MAVADYYNIYPTPEVCLVFLKTWVSEGYDRDGYEEDWNSTGLVNTVARFCNNTIVVTHSGGTNTMPWADNPNITAILPAHFPGQETGNSIVDVLYGDTNPSGHLPYTIATNESDYNTQIINATLTNDTDPNLFQDNFSEGLLIDYRHFDSANISPHYEFGYGLSYTDFTLLRVFSIQGSSGLSQYPQPAATEPGGNPIPFASVATATTSISKRGQSLVQQCCNYM